MIKVAVVEDDPDLLEELNFNLSDEGLSVTPCADGQALDLELGRQVFDAVVLDLGLPRESGESIVRRLRRDRPRLGIVIVSARNMRHDRVGLMEDGADVYLSKPVDMRELALVIRALVRRLKPETEAAPVPTLRADRQQLQVPPDQTVDLTPNETVLLTRMARATGRMVSRRELIEALGAHYLAYDERRLEALVSRLRKKLLAAGLPSQALIAVRGVGYSLQVELQERVA